MKVHLLKCQQCGAKTQMEEGLGECPYCGMQFVIPGLAKPAWPAGTTNTPNPEYDRKQGLAPPVRAVITGVLVLALLGGVALVVQGLAAEKSREAYVAWTPPEGTGQQSSPSVAELDETEGPPVFGWSSDFPIIASVDGDGIDDVIGYQQRGQAGSSLLAFAGSDGQLLWQSGVVPDVGADDGVDVYLAGDTLLTAGPGGELSGFSLRDGGTLWSLRLSEEVKTIQPYDAESVLILTTDGLNQRVSLQRGSVLPLPEGFEPSTPALEDLLPCSSDSDHNQGVRLANPIFEQGIPGYSHFDGMRGGRVASTSLEGFGLMLGARDAGTPVPLLLRYDPIQQDHKYTELWRTVVPGLRPLKGRIAGILNAELHASSELAVVVFYEDGGDIHAHRIAAFDMQDGHRLWEQEIQGRDPFNSATVVGDRVYVSVWNTLHVLDAKTGEGIFVLGLPPG